MSYITLPIATIRRPERQKGAFLVMTAVMLTALIGFTALAIDVGYSFSYRERMRNATDAAALAGAMAKHNNKNISATDLENVVRDVAEKNGFDDADNNIIVNVFSTPDNPPNVNFQKDYTDDPTAVGVEIIRNNKDTFFTLSALAAEQPIVYRSVANRGRTGIGTMFLFEPVGTAIKLSGSGSTIDVNGFVFLNSTSNYAISTGSGTLIADGVGTVAQNPVCGNCIKPSGEALKLIPNIQPMQDPLRHINPPNIPVKCDYVYKEVKNKDATLDPGTYCSLDKNKAAIYISGATAKFNPGIYILKGGGIDVQAGGGIASIDSEINGVMIYNTGGDFSTDQYGNPVKTNYPYRGIDLRNAGRNIKLFGYDDPSIPDYKGLLIFQDRNNSKTLKFGSGATTELNGIVYIIKKSEEKTPLPSIEYSSNSDTGASGYTIFVINSIELSGNGKFTMNSNYDDQGSPLLPRMSLAE